MLFALYFFIFCEKPVLFKDKLNLLFLLFKLFLGSESHFLLLLGKSLQHLFRPKNLPFFLLCKSIRLCLIKSFDVVALLLFECLLTLFLLSHNGFKEVALALG
jgi:hypothetical protein